MLLVVYVSAIAVPVEERMYACIVVAVPMILFLDPHLVPGYCGVTENTQNESIAQAHIPLACHSADGISIYGKARKDV